MGAATATDLASEVEEKRAHGIWNKLAESLVKEEGVSYIPNTENTDELFILRGLQLIIQDMKLDVRLTRHAWLMLVMVAKGRWETASCVFEVLTNNVKPLYFERDVIEAFKRIQRG